MDDEKCPSCGLTIEECSMRGILGLDAKEALQVDADLWEALKANYHRMHAAAFEQGYLAGKRRGDEGRIEALLTRIAETLHAENQKAGSASKERAERGEKEAAAYQAGAADTFCNVAVSLKHFATEASDRPSPP